MHLYERNRGALTNTPRLSIVHKIKYEHIHLNNFSKMRVIPCFLFEVLSESVSQALILTGGDEASETALFVAQMDKFFDCLNVSSFTKAKKERKPFMNPYRSKDDFRVKV